MLGSNSRVPQEVQEVNSVEWSCHKSKAYFCFESSTGCVNFVQLWRKTLWRPPTHQNGKGLAKGLSWIQNHQAWARKACQTRVRTKLNQKGEVSQSGFTSPNHFLVSARPGKCVALNFLNFLGNPVVASQHLLILWGMRGKGYWCGSSYTQVTPHPPDSHPPTQPPWAKMLWDRVKTRWLWDGRHGRSREQEIMRPTHPSLTNLAFTNHISFLDLMKKLNLISFWRTNSHS